MKKPSKSQLIKKADQYFSRYIRNKYAIDGYVSCITCGKSFPVEKIQAGHYIVRAKHATRYDERNVHPQCLMCNVFKHGELPKYALFLIQTYGSDILQELNNKSKILTKLGLADYQGIIDKYR